MHFLNPLYLLGLVAASIPVIIHLLVLRKNKTIEFSSIRFLKELQKTEIRRLKLKQILLLILRTLIIVFLVLSFARPVVKSNFPLLKTYSNVSAIVILDNSISMDVSDEFGNRFRQAKSIVNHLISNLKDGDELSVIFSSGEAEPPSFQFNFEAVKDEVSRSNISVLPSSFESAFRRAQKVLSKAKNFSKEIFIISDFQKSSLLPFSDSTKFFDENTTLHLIQIGAESKISINNLSIDTVYSLSSIYEVDKTIDFEVRIRNNSESSFENVVLSLYANGEKSTQRIFNIKGKSAQNVIISFVPKSSGAYRCMFEIESDALDYDNKYWMGIIVPEPPKVALITDNSTGYLATFLRSLDGKRIQYREISPNSISNVNLMDFSAIIIENLPMDNNAQAKIVEFAKSGGGIFLFPDPNASIKTLSSFLNQLGIFGNLEYKTFSAQNHPNFTFIDRNHILLQGVFKGGLDGKSATIDPPEINSMMPISNGISIFQTNIGSFLTEFKSGEIRVLYCAVAPSLGWGNFPVSSIFPVIVFRSVYYLGSPSFVSSVVCAGTNLSMNIPKSQSRSTMFNLEDPLSNKQVLNAINLPSGLLLDVRNLNMLGTYVLKDIQGKSIGTISVNIDSKESHLELSEQRTIENYFRSVVKKDVKISFVGKARKFVERDFRQSSSAELWKLFVFLALISAILEMIVARSTKKETIE
jgi:hypothetical protein